MVISRERNLDILSDIGLPLVHMEENRDISDSDSSSAPPTRFEDEELELTTTTDPKKRRQIQNRIAQRVYRQKQKKKLQDLEQQAMTHIRSVPSDSSQSLQFDFSRPILAQSPSSLTDEQTARYASWTPLEMTYPFANTITQRSACSSPFREEAAPDSIPRASPRAIGLRCVAPVDAESIVITSTSLRLAVLTNLQILGIPPTQYTLDSAISPFCSSNSSSSSISRSDARASMLQQRAPDLTPTRLQREIPHHPYIDVLPFRGLRDNLLVALDCGALDEPELCADISRHLRVWGRLPQLAMSYEWAPEFVEKWAWVLDGEALSISNFWRAQRGDAPFEV